VENDNGGNENETTAMADWLRSFLKGTDDQQVPKNEIPVEFFAILFDRFYNYFYEHGESLNRDSAFQRMTEISGIKVEFEYNLEFPYSRKDKSGEKYRIIVLPDVGNKTEKHQKAREAIKEFDCLEVLGTYQLLLSMLNSYLYYPKNLIDFINECDPDPSPEMIKTYKRMFEWLTRKGKELSEGGN